jgi:hypothetical protein
VHQDKLNAAIPGRKFRDQKKRKPGALTPGILSATHNAKDQVVRQLKGKPGSQKPALPAPLPVSSRLADRSPKNTVNQENTVEKSRFSEERPP